MLESSPGQARYIQRPDASPPKTDENKELMPNVDGAQY